MTPFSRIRARIERAVLRSIVSLPAPLLRSLAGPRRVSPDGMILDVEAQLLVRAAALARRGEREDSGVEGSRREMEGSTPVVDFQRIASRTESRTIPGPRGDISLRIIHPRSERSPRPVLVYFHGGGWVVGSIASHDGVCRALARGADAIVVSVDYRLAPEHRFPAGVDDAIAATRWVLAEASSFGGDARAVAVGGDSAGGNFAALVALETRGDAARPMFQLLVYPATDLTRSFESHRLFREGYMLDETTIDWYLAQYLNDESEKRSPRASPFFAADLRGLPRALVLTAGFDPLRDEGRAYAEKMRAAGVEVEHRCVEGAVHGFFSCGGVFTHSRRAVNDAARTLRSAFERAG